MADLNLKAGTNMSIRQEDTDLYLDNTYEYDDTQIQQDLLTRSLITETGKTIELTLNNTNYKMTAILKNKYGNVISTSNEIDLPIESLVVSIYYDSTTKELVFVLKDGTTTRVPLLDLIDGLATEEDLETFEDDINEDMETFKGDVEQELEKAQQDLSMYKMLENALPKVEGEGESITLEDTAKCPMHLNFKGQIQQDSTTGKNLLPITTTGTFTHNGITFTTNADGSVKVQGTATANANAVLGTNGYFSSSNLYASDGVAILNTNGQYYYSSSATTTRVIIVESDTANYAVQLSNIQGSFTYTGTIRLMLRVNSGATVNETIYPMLESGSSATNWEKYSGGSPSPNPDYPQDIHIVSGDNEIKVDGKNILLNATWATNKAINNNNEIVDLTGWSYCDYIDIENSNYYYSPNSGQTPKTILYDENKNVVHVISLSFNTTYDISSYNAKYIRVSVSNAAKDNVKVYKEYTKEINLPVENLLPINQIQTQTINGLTITNLGDGTLAIDGTSTNGTSIDIAYNYKLKANTTYNWTNFNTINLSANSIILRDSNNNTITYINFDVTTKTYSSSSEATISKMRLRIETGQTFNHYILKVQFNEGTKKNSFTPYGTTPIEVGAIGDYEDEFFKNTIDSEYYDSTLEKDKWYLKKRIGKVVLDGSENWSKSSNTSVDRFIQANARPDLIVLEALSNYFTYNLNSTNSGTFYLQYSTDQYKGRIVVNFSSYGTTTLEQFKNWLSTHNTIVYYVLATPTNTLLNDTLQETLDSFYSWQEQTNISQENNDMPFVIKASAIYDLTDLVNRVATLETE